MARLAMALALVCSLLWCAAAAAEEPAVLSSKITKVTVYSDRAQVTREAVLSLEGGRKEVAFKKLPGWVDDASVRVALLPTEKGRIADVRVLRDYLARSTSEEYRKAEAAVQEIADQIAALEDELRVLDAQEKQVEAMKVFAAEKLTREGTNRDVNVESYGKVLKFVGDQLREIAKARRAIAAKRRDLEPELTARQLRLQELQNLTQLEETTVQVAVEGEGGNVRLELTYMLPGATWEPAHELRARGPNPESVELASVAVVTQTSGEDWEGVELTFATQSSTETIRIPELTALTLGEGGAAARLVEERAASFDRAKEAFEGQNRLWTQLNAPVQQGNQMEAYDENYYRMQAVQAKTEEMFQRLRTRGTTAHFAGAGRPTVRGDGSEVRVPVGKTTLAAKQAIVAAPEESLNAARTLEMVNSGGQPILPGSVALYQDGAFLGMTALDFVAEGESFAVFLGVADQVKLSRVLDRSASSIDRGKKRTKMKVAFDVTVENLSAEAVTLDLTDRVPVSQDEAIEVTDIEVSGDKEPDKKGLLKWHLTLKGKEKKKFRISYQITYPSELAEEVRRTRMEKKAAYPSAAPSKSMDVPEQIIDLEDAF